MAQISYRANLSAAIFPMTLARAGRSVIIPGPDQNFDRRVDPQGEQKDAGIPQVIYMENVFPTSNGYQSVGYQSTVDVLPYTDMAIIEVKMPGAAYPEVLAFNVGGTQVYRLNGTAWSPVTRSGPLTLFYAEEFFSTATVGGTTYIMDADTTYTPSARLYKYSVTSGGAGFLDEISASVTPAGTLDRVRGMTGAYNYLIFLEGVSTVTVKWSSTLSPVDFTPSLVTGAGSTGVGNVQGIGQFLRASPEGFNIYTDNNVIAASYTGNARYPWRFVPIKDSLGVSYTWNAYSDPDESSQFMISRTGQILALNKDGSRGVASEVSEYLERDYTIDSFDYTTDIFTVAPRAQDYREGYRLYVFANRYVFVSYKEGAIGDPRPGIFEAAFVYDTQLNRYGKINRTHSHVITMKRANSDRLFIGLVNVSDKSLFQVSLDISDADEVESKGVLLLGKFQYVRSRDLCLDELSFESGQVYGSNPPFPGNFHVRTYQTRNGKDFLAPQTPYYRAADSSSAVSNYFSSAEGRNISVLVKGAFDLCSVELIFHVGGAT